MRVSKTNHVLRFTNTFAGTVCHPGLDPGSYRGIVIEIPDHVPAFGRQVRDDNWNKPE